MIQFIQEKCDKVQSEVIFLKQKIINFLYIFIGLTCMSFALSTLLFENNIIAGGVSGIGVVMNHYFGLNISLVVGALNISLFFLGLIILGKEFAMTTLVSTFVFPLLLEFFESQSLFHG